MTGSRWLRNGLFLLAVLACCGAFGLSGQDAPDCPDCRGDVPENCTVIMVGRLASTDGSVMTTHTCDCGHCDWTFRRVPAADHPAGATRKIFHVDQMDHWPPDKGLKWDRVGIDNLTGLEIPQVPHTHGYIHGSFGYMNDRQVAIGESTIGCRKRMENQTASAKFDITMLSLIAMERASTAREAIEVMGELAERHGYGGTDSGEMLAVADPKEVWHFEIMPVGPLWTPQSGKPGAVWCAQRVPDDEVAVCPNESRIGLIDLAKPGSFMASPNVVSLAVDMGFYDPKSGQPFHWAKAYNPDNSSAANTRGARVRQWRFLDLVAPSKKFSPETLNVDLPFSVKPDRKLSVYDVMVMTRDKCEGTPYWPGRGIQGGPFSNPNYLPYGFELEGRRYSLPRIIGVNRAEYVTVTQSRGWLPDPIGGLVWLAWGAQDTSCFMPLYNGMTKIPRSFEIGDHYEFDRDSARWAFDYVDFHTQVVYAQAIEDVRAAQLEYEKTAVDRTPTIDAFAADLYKKDPALLAKFLDEYSLSNADRVVDAWWKLGDDLLVKYNHMWVFDAKAKKRAALKFPDWWLKLLVEYNKLEPQP
ncbi:MAG: C69 family dipeptidase, partial [Candidatus Aminicenantes bacterium]|nr:C69 family dipeptidase [Candidatus Aminicenantes bacterium]